MQEDIKRTLCALQERAAKDIQKLLDAKPDFSTTEWKAASDAMEIIKNVEKSIKDSTTTMAMEDEYGSTWEEEDSYMGMNYGRRSMPNYSRRMPKNSYRGSSYSNGNSATIANLRNLMDNASNESERMMYQRFIDEAEHM